MASKAQTYLNYLGNEIINAMRKDIYNLSGELSRTMKADVINDVYGTSLHITMQLYGLYVDEGTCGTDSCGGKHHKYKGTGSPKARNMPPVSDLRKWATSKGLNVWAVAKNIQKYGTASHPFVYNFEKVIKQHQQELINMFGYDINNRVEKQIKNAWH